MYDCGCDEDSGEIGGRVLLCLVDHQREYVREIALIHVQRGRGSGGLVEAGEGPCLSIYRRVAS